MRKLNKLFLPLITLIWLGCGKSSAQPQMFTNNANMDPQQFQQRMQQRASEFLRDQLVVTNDEEWSVIEPRLSKVTTLRAETVMSGLGGMRGMMGNLGNRGGNGQGGGNNQAGNNRRFASMMGQPSPEADTLQRAIADKAPKEQLKAAMTAYRESRRRKQAELTAAEEQLRQLLSIRQEAILVSLGILD